MVTQLSTGRSIAVLAVVIGCFAILWPKLFLPFFRESVSLNSKATSVDKPDMSMMHPRMKQLMQQSNMNVIRTETSRPFPSMGRRNVKSVPQKQGAVGFVMPLYTVGIIVFFLYTILKIAVRGNDNEQTEASQPPFPDERILQKTEIDKNLCKLLFADDYKHEMVKQFKENCHLFFDETRRINEKMKHSSCEQINQNIEDEKDLEIKKLRKMLAEKELLMKTMLQQNDTDIQNQHSNEVQGNIKETNQTSRNKCDQESETEDENETETCNTCVTTQPEIENTESSEEENGSDANEEFESDSEKQSSAQNSWTSLFTEE